MKHVTCDAPTVNPKRGFFICNDKKSSKENQPEQENVNDPETVRYKVVNLFPGGLSKPSNILTHFLYGYVGHLWFDSIRSIRDINSLI